MQLPHRAPSARLWLSKPVEAPTAIIRIISSTKQQPSNDGRVNLCLTGAAQVNVREKWVALDKYSIDSVTPFFPS